MSALYIMDACALIAFLRDETGADAVAEILESASNKAADIRMNSLNLLEVYYDIYRSIGKVKADEELAMIKNLPMAIQEKLADEVFAEAGRLKATYKISLADSIALAEASVADALLLTADHHEFEAVEKNEKIRFQWIR